MKKNYILLVLFLMILQTNAQSFYTLTTTIDKYSDLLNPISINNGQVWEGGSFNDPIPVPFPINIAGESVDNFAFNYGSFLFSNNQELYNLQPTGIFVKDKSLQPDVSISSLNYQIDGEAGSRILKIEVKNAGSVTEFEVNGTHNLFINFQIWIYEGTDVIEFRYGASNIDATAMAMLDPNNPLLLGIATYTTYNCFVYGNLADPTFIEPSLDEYWGDYRITSYPVERTVYRFTPNTTAGTDDFNKTQFRMYPNPVTSILSISLEKMDVSDYTITDMTGKMIRKGNFKALENTLQIEDLTSGVYFIRIGDTTKKFLKK